MNCFQSVPANSQSPELLQPTDRPLDRPAPRSQRRRLLPATPGNVWHDADVVEKVASGLPVVPTRRPY